LFLGRCADPDVVGKLARDFFQHLEAGGVDAVVVGEEDSQALAPCSLVLSLSKDA
jgi:hypothetical protein